MRQKDRATPLQTGWPAVNTVKQKILGRLGPLTTRLAETEAEIAKAQRLRFDIFHREGGARLNAESMAAEQDMDAFDAKCLHLLVEHEENLVGTTRLHIARASKQTSSFYTATEFELTPFLAAHHGQIVMELGRSCIAPAHRSRRAMELLWHGVWTIALRYNVATMFGCASLPGTSGTEHEAALAYLASCASEDAMPLPLRKSRIPAMPDIIEGLDEKRIFARLPALLKGYLRLGARIAPQAVIDPDFDTTDLFVAVDVATINPRYLAHYGEQATRYAA